jgi:hypothetical protein
MACGTTVVSPSKDSVPADSGAFRSQFCGREIIKAVLIVGGVAFEKAGTPRITVRADPARARDAPALARAANDREPHSPVRAYWSVYESTHRTRGARRAAGSRSTRTECPNLLARYFYLWRTTVVWQAIDTGWVSASLGGPVVAWAWARVPGQGLDQYFLTKSSCRPTRPNSIPSSDYGCISETIASRTAFSRPLARSSTPAVTPGIGCSAKPDAFDPCVPIPGSNRSAANQVGY